MVATEAKAATLGGVLEDAAGKGIDEEEKGQEGDVEEGHFVPVALEIGEQAGFAGGAS